MHLRTEPPILYFGTPVVLISTLNEDGTANIAPMSSAFWLGWRCMIGLAAVSQTPRNLRRTGECVLNLPSVDLVGAVDRLALTTGSDPVPAGKVSRGYRTERDKFERAGLTPVAAETVGAPRIAECPVQMEAKLVAQHDLYSDDPALHGRTATFELRVTRVHAHSSILATDNPNRIDPDRWRPLIMSFQRFYGLGDEVHPSALATVPENLYLTPDVVRARETDRR